jgi:hypothetical protein
MPVNRLTCLSAIAYNGFCPRVLENGRKRDSLPALRRPRRHSNKLKRFLPFQDRHFPLLSSGECYAP